MWNLDPSLQVYCSKEPARFCLLIYIYIYIYIYICVCVCVCVCVCLEDCGYGICLYRIYEGFFYYWIWEFDVWQLLDMSFSIYIKKISYRPNIPEMEENSTTVIEPL